MNHGTSNPEILGSPASKTPGFRLLLISVLAAFTGLGAGLLAYVLFALIGLCTNLFFFQRISFSLPTISQNPLGGWIIAIPMVGGLIVGLMARYGTEKIRGHGIPEAMEAVLTNRSRIHPKVAIFKPISAAIAIGTGGPFGAEGPIIQTGGALGSLIGQAVHTTAAERRVLLACGAAAGMSATFSTPIAAVILAIELLLFEFKSRSFIPLAIASTLGATVHVFLLGSGPMFSMGSVDFGIPGALPLYLLLGVICGLAAVVLSKSLYFIEDLFEWLPVSEMWWPAIGGLGLGCIGYFFPRVLGVGYETISDILNNRLGWELLLAVMVLKSLALVVSLGSGTSGGLLAPMFMAGAALGGIFAVAVNSIIPGAHLAPAACALVAMGAVFGAASRATFAFIVFAFEITRDYNAVLPLMLVTVVADGVGRYFMANSIMTEKLARRGLRVDHEYGSDVLNQRTVRDVMSVDVQTVPAAMLVDDLASLFARHDPSVTHHHALGILSEAGELCGIITRGDVFRSVGDTGNSGLTVLDAGCRKVIVTTEEEPLHTAAETMLKNSIGRLLVVSADNPGRLVGYLGRPNILTARLQRMDEEYVREPGWLGRFARGRSSKGPIESPTHP